MDADAVVRNGRVVTPHGIIFGGIAVRDKRIAAIASDHELPPARETHDAHGHYILPGIIDPHVHLAHGEPGLPETNEARMVSDFRSETRGAVYGGVTCCVTRIVSPGSYKEVFSNAVRWGEGNSLIDFAFNAACFEPVHFEEQRWLYERGVAAFKHFYTASEYIKGIDEGVLYQSCENIARLGAPALAMIHCEDMALLSRLRLRVKNSGRNDTAAWTESRPEICELMRLEAASLIAEKTGAPLYIVHLSIGSGVEVVERYLDRGARVYAETCPHYLLLHQDMPELGGWGKVCPPLRTRRDQELLWVGLQKGLIQTMGSDHCPYTREAKEQGQGKENLWGALPGFSNGMEHLLPLMWTHGVHTGRLSVEQLAKVCSENPARLFGLYPRKGALLPGADADLIIVDPNRKAFIDESFYHTRSADWSVFFGHEVRGLCTFTMVRGEVLYKDGKVNEKYGHGKFIQARA